VGKKKRKKDVASGNQPTILNEKVQPAAGWRLNATLLVGKRKIKPQWSTGVEGSQQHPI